MSELLDIVAFVRFLWCSCRVYLHMLMVNIVKISCSKWDNFLSDCDTNVSFVQQNLHKAGQLAKAFEHKRKGNTQSITDDQSFLHAQSEPQE